MPGRSRSRALRRGVVHREHERGTDVVAPGRDRAGERDLRVRLRGGSPLEHRRERPPVPARSCRLPRGRVGVPDGRAPRLFVPRHLISRKGAQGGYGDQAGGVREPSSGGVRSGPGPHGPAAWDGGGEVAAAPGRFYPVLDSRFRAVEQVSQAAMEARTVDGFTEIGMGHGAQEATVERGPPSLQPAVRARSHSPGLAGTVVRGLIPRPAICPRP